MSNSIVHVESAKRYCGKIVLPLMTTFRMGCTVSVSQHLDQYNDEYPCLYYHIVCNSKTVEHFSFPRCDFLLIIWIFSMYLQPNLHVRTAGRLLAVFLFYNELNFCCQRFFCSICFKAVLWLSIRRNSYKCHTVIYIGVAYQNISKQES